MLGAVDSLVLRAPSMGGDERFCYLIGHSVSADSIFISSRDPATGTWSSWAGQALTFQYGPAPAWGSEANAIDIRDVTVVGGVNDPSGPAVAIVDLIGPTQASLWTVAADTKSGVANGVLQVFSLREERSLPPRPSWADAEVLPSSGLFDLVRTPDGQVYMLCVDVPWYPPGDIFLYQVPLGGSGQPASLLSAVTCWDPTAQAWSLFGVEEGTNRLWVCRASTPIGDTVFPEFLAWSALGVQLAAIMAAWNDPLEQLFGITLDGRIIQLVQSQLPPPLGTSTPVGGPWYERELGVQVQPSDVPAQLGTRGQDGTLPAAGYAFHVTPVGANGAPIPGASIEVTADRPVDLVVGNGTYLAGPAPPVVLAADMFGCIELRNAAGSLASPTLTVTSGQVTKTINAAGRAYAKLAQIEGPDLDGLVDPSVDDEQKDKLASALQTLGAALAAKAQSQTAGDPYSGSVSVVSA